VEKKREKKWSEDVPQKKKSFLLFATIPDKYQVVYMFHT